MSYATLPFSRSAVSRYLPDITSTQFWEKRVIYIAQITNVTFAQDTEWEVLAAGEMVCKIIDTISGNPRQDIIKIETSNALLLSGKNTMDITQLKINDLLLVIEPNIPGEMFALKSYHIASKDFLIEALTKIALINRNLSIPNLFENAILDDNLVSKFCLIRLLNTSENIGIFSDYIDKMQAVVDNSERNGAVRVLAIQLISKMKGREDDIEMEYTMIVKTIQECAYKDWNQIMPFMNRLLDFKHKRSDSVKLLAMLVLDRQANMPVRIAAYNTIIDQRAFDYFKPDIESERIFETCVDMLNDASPDIRRAGGILLHQIVSRITNANSLTRYTFALRAEKQLQDVLQNETDIPTKLSLEQHLRNIKNPPKSRRSSPNKI